MRCGDDKSFCRIAMTYESRLSSESVDRLQRSLEFEVKEDFSTLNCEIFSFSTLPLRRLELSPQTSASLVSSRIMTLPDSARALAGSSHPRLRPPDPRRPSGSTGDAGSWLPLIGTGKGCGHYVYGSPQASAKVAAFGSFSSSTRRI